MVGASDTPTLFCVSLWAIHKRGLVRLTHQPSFMSAFGPYTKEGWCVWHTNLLVCQPLGHTQKRVGAYGTPTLFCVSLWARQKRWLVRLTHQPSFVSAFKPDTKEGWCVLHTNPFLCQPLGKTQTRVGASDTPALFCASLWTRHKRGLVCLTHQPSFVSAFMPDTKEGWCV